MPEKTFAVFIYGSLLPGHGNHHVAAPYIRLTQPGVIAGRLVDYGPYPALVRDAEAQAKGASVCGLWITVDERGLREMDELEQFVGIEEENDYDRVWAEDLEASEYRGWVYVWESPRGCPAIEETYWPDYLARRGKKEYE
ncbi:gamma-glutamylcyclotransferase family protein [Paenibacillus glycinis]|nr:gamma-glutamylcyclotransferase family protein [Paenibacillus glycinis]